MHIDEYGIHSIDFLLLFVHFYLSELIIYGPKLIYRYAASNG